MRERLSPAPSPSPALILLEQFRHDAAQLELSHLGYVHLKTIGGNARLHMNAPTKVTADERSVKVVRQMPGSVPPPTYRAAWPFGASCATPNASQQALQKLLRLEAAPASLAVC